MARSPANFAVPRERDRRQKHPRSSFGSLRALLFRLIDSSAFRVVSLGREVSIIFTANGPLIYRLETNQDVRNKSARQAGGGTSSGGRPLHINIFNDKEEMTQHTINHPEAEHMVVRTAQKHRFSLRV
jgi:hypothetical protein